MLHLSVRCVISLFFLEKQSEIRNAFTFFEKWKVKKIILSLFLRNEKWNDFLFHSFREVKVKLRYLEIEIEKWNFKKNLENSRETRLSLVTVCSFSRYCFTSLALGSDLLHSGYGQLYSIVLPLCILGNSFAFLWSLFMWSFRPTMLANPSSHWSHLKVFLVAPTSSVSLSM